MMTKRKINPVDYAKEILTAIPKGVLLTTKAGEKVNAMTIGWGTMGTNWSRPVFAAYIRKGRFTAEMLEKNPEWLHYVPVHFIGDEIKNWGSAQQVLAYIHYETNTREESGAFADEILKTLSVKGEQGEDLLFNLYR